jgi:hypothetical protein
MGTAEAWRPVDRPPLTDDRADPRWDSRVLVVEHFAAALSALAEAPELTLEAAVLNNLATAQAVGGSYPQATATARAALDLGVRLGVRLAALHANLVDRLHELGDDTEAMEHLKASVALFAEVGEDPLDRPDVWTLTA